MSLKDKHLPTQDNMLLFWWLMPSLSIVTVVIAVIVVLVIDVEATLCMTSSRRSGAHVWIVSGALRVKMCVV